jgi:DNA polymerase
MKVETFDILNAGPRNRFTVNGRVVHNSTGEGPQPTNLPKAGPDTIECGAWRDTDDGPQFVEGSGCRRHYGLGHTACPHCQTPKFPKPYKVEWNPAVAEEALTVIATRSLEWVEYVYGAGAGLSVVSGCLRALFDAAPGCDLVSSDFNSIEAVGLAMIASEKWRIDVFNSHGKIYEASASQSFKVPLEEFWEHKKRTKQHHPLRQKGKIGELAFGYQGWLGSAKAFEMPGTDDEIKANILAWRAASPAIEWLWGGQTRGKASNVLRNATAPDYAGALDDRLRWLAGCDRWDDQQYLFGVEGMAVAALLQPGTWLDVSRLSGEHSGVSFLFDAAGDALYCRIPSGRVLTYHRPLLMNSDRGGYSLSYEGWNTNPKNGPKGWIRMNTWGGRLVENIVQATCRDVLRYAVLNLEAAGYPVVLHVYDEIVSEVPESFGSTAEFESIVERRPPWAKDWPIRAPGAYRAKRYRKG